MITHEQFIEKLKHAKFAQTFTDHHWTMVSLILDAYQRCQDPMFEQFYFKNLDELKNPKTQTK